MQPNPASVRVALNGEPHWLIVLLTIRRMPTFYSGYGWLDFRAIGRATSVRTRKYDRCSHSHATACGYQADINTRLQKFIYLTWSRPKRLKGASVIVRWNGKRGHSSCHIAHTGCFQQSIQASISASKPIRVINYPSATRICRTRLGSKRAEGWN
jgi:hypothetical protein